MLVRSEEITRSTSNNFLRSTTMIRSQYEEKVETIETKREVNMTD
jgi:hypothetical protein